jgi:hypothetical protein
MRGGEVEEVPLSPRCHYHLTLIALRPSSLTRVSHGDRLCIKLAHAGLVRYLKKKN